MFRKQSVLIKLAGLILTITSICMARASDISGKYESGNPHRHAEVIITPIVADQYHVEINTNHAGGCGGLLKATGKVSKRMVVLALQSCVMGKL